MSYLFTYKHKTILSFGGNKLNITARGWGKVEAEATYILNVLFLDMKTKTFNLKLQATFTTYNMISCGLKPLLISYLPTEKDKKEIRFYLMTEQSQATICLT